MLTQSSCSNTVFCFRGFAALAVTASTGRTVSTEGDTLFILLVFTNKHFILRNLHYLQSLSYSNYSFKVIVTLWIIASRRLRFTDAATATAMAPRGGYFLFYRFFFPSTLNSIDICLRTDKRPVTGF